MGGPANNHKYDKAIGELCDWVHTHDRRRLASEGMQHWNTQTIRKALNRVQWLFGYAAVYEDNLALPVTHEIQERFAGRCLKYQFEGLPGQSESWYRDAVREAKKKGYNR
jgi:hypothetical protein